MFGNYSEFLGRFRLLFPSRETEARAPVSSRPQKKTRRVILSGDEIFADTDSPELVAAARATLREDTNFRQNVADTFGLIDRVFGEAFRLKASRNPFMRRENGKHGRYLH